MSESPKKYNKKPEESLAKKTLPDEGVVDSTTPEFKRASETFNKDETPLTDLINKLSDDEVAEIHKDSGHPSKATTDLERISCALSHATMAINLLTLVSDPALSNNAILAIGKFKGAIVKLSLIPVAK